MKNNSSRNAGFTLLEIMVSLAIFAVVSISFYYQIASLLKSNARIEEKYIASIVAENTLETYFFKRLWPSDGEEDFEVDMHGRQWQVTVKISESDIKNMKKLEALVYQKGGDPDYPVVTLMRLIGKN